MLFWILPCSSSVCCSSELLLVCIFVAGQGLINTLGSQWKQLTRWCDEKLAMLCLVKIPWTSNTWHLTYEYFSGTWSLFTMLETTSSCQYCAPGITAENHLPYEKVTVRTLVAAVVNIWWKSFCSQCATQPLVQPSLSRLKKAMACYIYHIRLKKWHKIPG